MHGTAKNDGGLTQANVLQLTFRQKDNQKRLNNLYSTLFMCILITKKFIVRPGIVFNFQIR
jgi:hypothetical protein